MYSDFLTVSDKIPKSINIEFDLHQSDRLESFIPTSSTCLIMKKYIKTALGLSHDYSTVLIGPYGKGKSMLILVLTELLSAENSVAVERLLQKIDKVDPELVRLVKEYKNKKNRLLPVVINSNYNNLEQAFLLALKHALDRNGLSDYLPSTQFSACKSIIDNWKSIDDIQQKLKSCFDSEKTDPDSLINDLECFSNEAMDKFKRIYSCLSFGLEFNPLADNDPIKIYQSVLNDLKNTEYNGFFIIFDEFSKAVEGTDKNLGPNLKTIQDFAELASRSSDSNQIFLTCITHKSLNLYADPNDAVSVSSFRSVEGRFTEIQMIRNESESYELIAYSLLKKHNYGKARDDFYANHTEFFKSLSQSNLIDKDWFDFIKNETFPFNPLGLVSLIHLSEHVAQNERTLMTSILDTDEDSFRSFIETNGAELYSAPNLFDYFSEQIEKEPSYQNIWYRASGLLRGELNSLQVNIVKALAIIQIIKDSSPIIANEKDIALLLNEDLSKINAELANLEKRKLLKKNSFDETFDFASDASKEIDERLEAVLAKPFEDHEKSRALSELMNERYCLPYQYNLKHRMLRYFDSVSVLDEQLLRNPNVISTATEGVSDGFVINVLVEKANLDIVQEKVKELIKGNDSLTVFRLIKVPEKGFMKSFNKYLGLLRISASSLSESGINEYQVITEEMKLNLSNLIRRFESDSLLFLASPDNKTVDTCKGNSMVLSQIISDLLENAYSATPVVNNEMINKHQVSRGYEKPLLTINDKVLERNIEEFIEQTSPTSPERSIYRAFFYQKKPKSELSQILDYIKAYFFVDAGNSHIPFEELVTTMKEKPYGIREGVIPTLIAIAFSEIDALPILYYQNRELPLNARNLNKAVSNPGSYSVRINNNAKELDSYIRDILKIFGLKADRSFYQNLNKALAGIRSYFNGLPTIIRESSKRNNPLRLSDNYLKLKSKALTSDVNSFELFASFLPDLLSSDFNGSVAFLSAMDEENRKIPLYKKSIIDKLIATFEGENESSIKSSYDFFTHKSRITPESVILDGKEQDLKRILNSCTFNDFDTLSEISHLVTGYVIEDWSTDRTNEVIDFVESFKSNLIAFQKVDVVTGTEKSSEGSSEDSELSQMELSIFGKMLCNSIESSLSEFGDSVSNLEKLSILTRLIDQIKKR